MKLAGFVVALQWATVCFVPVAAQDISALGSLLSNMQQYASLASQILSFAQPFLGASNAINADVGSGSSSSFNSPLSSSNSYPQGGADGLFGGLGASAPRQSSGFGGLLGQFLGGGGGGGGGGRGGGAFGDLLAAAPTLTSPRARAKGASIRKASAERIRQQEFESLLASFVGSGVEPAKPDPADRSILSEFFGRRKRRSLLLK